MPARLLLLTAVAAACLVLCGCNIVGAFTYLLAPPQIQKAEFTLTRGRLAILIEPARPEDENPVFTQALYDKLVEIFREKKVNDQVVPLKDVQRLRQVNPDFDRWPMQRIAQALNAQQLLYIRVERLALRSAGQRPVLEPSVELRVKVIDASASPREARVWPKGEELGRTIQRGRPMREATDATAVDAEAAKLGKDAARLVARCFHDVDLEEKDEWEP